MASAEGSHGEWNPQKIRTPVPIEQKIRDNFPKINSPPRLRETPGTVKHFLEKLLKNPIFGQKWQKLGKFEIWKQKKCKFFELYQFSHGVKCRRKILVLRENGDPDQSQKNIPIRPLQKYTPRRVLILRRVRGNVSQIQKTQVLCGGHSCAENHSGTKIPKFSSTFDYRTPCHFTHPQWRVKTSWPPWQITGGVGESLNDCAFIPLELIS